MLTSIVGVVVLLGGLIFFHELGHYTIAKLFGVKVEVFSLGFGKKLFSWKYGETEYCVSIFPLGGYVKLMGDDPYKGVPAGEADRAFSTQKLYKRFLIVAAGPLANLLLAILLFITVFWFGQPMPAARIGMVQYASPAWESGLRARDRILEIDGKKVLSWADVEEALRKREGDRLDLKIERGGAELKVPVTVGRVKTKNPFGEDEEVGGIKGMSLQPLAAMIGISDSKSLAYQAGLRTGDLVVKVDARPVELYDELNDALAANWAAGKPVVLTVRRKSSPDAKEDGQEKSFTLTLPEPQEKPTYLGAAQALGIYPSELFVFKVSAGSPAEKGGLQPGDRITKVGEQDVFNFENIVDAVQDLGGRDQSANFALEREGQAVILNLKPTMTMQEDPLTRQPVKKFMVGLIPLTAFGSVELVKFKIREIGPLVSKAVSEVYLLAYRMVVSLAKLVVGQISVKNLGGPVLIASVAGKSLDAGIIPFLQMMALISINLFLLNLFPIPVLDGGHLLFFALEAVKGKPVSIRTMEIANQVGMVFILMLVGLTFFNDISRIFLH